MLGANVVVLEALCFLLSQAQYFSGSLGEFVKPVPISHGSSSSFEGGRPLGSFLRYSVFALNVSFSFATSIHWQSCILLYLLTFSSHCSNGEVAILCRKRLRW